jgi:hypothetical protein
MDSLFNLIPRNGSARRSLFLRFAMLKNKHVDMPSRKHDNLPL